MSLKAVLFDFNGVIINDEPLHQQLIDQILLNENLRPQRGEFRRLCLGRSNRACLQDILTQRGRVVSETYLNELLNRKAQAYQSELAKIEKLPTYPGLEDLIFQLRSAKLKLGIVTGAIAQEVQFVLNRLKLAEYFTVMVTGDDTRVSKPEPDGYLLAIERFKEQYSGLNLQPGECLAVEHTPIGILAAKRAGMSVVGVANTYPFHMLQRQANWTVDYLCDLELERVQQSPRRRLPKC